MSENDQKPDFGINLNAVHCPKCGQRMPSVRLPESLHQLMWGGWTCPHCGCRMDKWGKPIEPTGEESPGSV